MQIQKNFRKEQWKMLFITMFCYLFFYTGRHNFGWAAKGMSAELGISYQQIGWISFSMLMGYAIGQLINGNLADRLSPKIMILTGGFLSIVCNLSISYANTYVVILILWTLNGYFQSMAWGSGSKLISNWWDSNERGKAFGFYTMAAGSSSVLTFFMALLLVQQEQSWRTLFRYPILFLLFALVLFLIIARSHPSLKGFTLQSDSAQNDSTSKLGWKESYKLVFGNKKFLIASFAIGFQSMARYGLIFWVPIHFLGNNYKESNGNLWLTLFIPIGMAVGAVSFGYISDLLFNKNRSKSIRAGMLISSAIALLIYFIPTPHHILAAVLMFTSGFFVYGPQANFWTLSPDILGTKLVGTGIGVMNMFAYVFAAIGEPIFGKIIDYTGDTSNIFLVVAVICALCATVISFVKPATPVKNDQ
ncbi:MULTISPECIES: MFS transporter [unclassified Sphingobacterium]|uniref:MFS transporter n=1 Tax=unclassified Sphingobacterium TaxID=2609468 RepID=UPI0010E265AD|nr:MULTISPECIES: MFS transporter [unclassified Sphingobacterium]MCS3554300.1 OPA family glycerol-3-phosphate transporter-like MFS transporter [Sphingobacterium sp. JUb21]TCR08133.1 OPA family glycerol-3-phosphate transporter-like MFS transporter [Sphingobacterium sp. JUb20]